METRFLKTFVLVADTGSMAEAARRLDLTPAAVALQIQVLEKDLDEKLVARAGRTVRPTAAGHRLLGRAVEVLRAFDALQTLVREDIVAGELRLGTINTALHTRLPGMLGWLAKAHPGVTVFIQSGTSLQLYEAVHRGDLDAAVCLLPDFAMPKALAWEPLWDEPLVVLAPPSLAARDPRDLLRRQPLLRYDRSLGGGKQAERYLQKHRIVPIERFELSSLLAIAMMVSEGLGVSIVPDIASPLTRNLKVAALALPDAPFARRIAVLWRRDSPRARLVAAFMEEARKDVRRA